MLIELSKLPDTPVGSFEEGGFVGKVQKPIINPEEGRLIGFLVKTGGFFGKDKIASIGDVIDIDRGGLVLRSSDCLVEKDEIVRISEIIKTNFKLINLKAVQKNSKFIGRVKDALIDSNTGDIMRLYVRRYFQEFVFERSQIVEITLKNVVLKTDKTQKVKKPVAELARAEIA